MLWRNGKSYLRLMFFSLMVSSLLGAGNAWSRPTIGLVLSGGGARGAAHVGVIQVLEEMNIPVDFIAGTSMGSIIGGLYAIGTPPAEIEELTTKIDWTAMFSDTVPRQRQFYREKAGRENYLAHLKIDAQEGLSLPKGLISGKKLDLTLRALTLGAGDDFNAFPIPFRAVATNVETGDMVVLGKGDLAKSLRASMAIPAAFAPVEIDGLQLVDGGVARNLPVDVARQMGADVIIAINIGTPLDTADKLTNFLAITNQTSGFLTNRNVDTQIQTLKEGDILITPDLGDITTASFTKMPAAVAAGRQAALAASEALKRYAMSPEEFQAFRQQQLKASHRPGKLEFFEVKQKDVINARILSGRLKKNIEKIRGKRAEADTLAQIVFEIYERGDLESIDFKLIEKDGKQGLLLEPKPKEHMQHNIDIGVQLSNDFKGDTTYGLLLEYTLANINRFGGGWKNKIQLGEQRLFFTEFYQPLEASAWRFFVAPNGQYEVDPVYLYDGSNRVAEYDIKTAYAGADLGYQLAEFGEVRVGLIKGTTRTALTTGEPTLPERTFHYAGYRASLVYDQIDNTGFPRQGGLLQTTFQAGRTALGSDETFNTIMVKAVKPFTIGRSTVIARARWESLLTSTEEFNQQFFLGGFLNLSGLTPNQLHGQQLALGELIYTFRILKQKAFGNDLYGGISAETGNVWQKRSDVSSQDLRYSGCVFVGADSLIGPVYLGYGYSEGGNNALYFYIGSFF